MRILRPDDGRYPYSIGQRAGGRGSGPVGIELVNEENVVGDFARRASRIPAPACVCFDKRVIDLICEVLLLWPTDSGLARLEEQILNVAIRRYGRASMSLWIHSDATDAEIARTLVEEFADPDQEKLIFEAPWVGADRKFKKTLRNPLWVLNVPAIDTWRVARYLVLEENG